MKKSEYTNGIRKKDFLKSVLASWKWIIYELFMCILFGFVIFNMAESFIKERIKIADSVPVYEVAEGIVSNVTVHKFYSDRRAGQIPDFIPDKKYSAEVSYTDRSGIIHQFRILRVDKKLVSGKGIKVVYDPAEKANADIAYFDVWVQSYVPYHLNTFTLFDGIILGVSILIIILHGELLWGTLTECAHKEYKSKKHTY